jgi:uncharacterized protein YcfJ
LTGTNVARELVLEGGKSMKTAFLVHGMKRYVAVVLILLTLGFAVEPITSVVSAHPAAAAAAQTRRRVRRHRSFWKKHRDKLTVAGTALGGAAVGGLAGGKKGAAIGALAGGGGGALYTYKLRRRHRRRY